MPRARVKQVSLRPDCPYSRPACPGSGVLSRVSKQLKDRQDQDPAYIRRVEDAQAKLPFATLSSYRLDLLHWLTALSGKMGVPLAPGTHQAVFRSILPPEFTSSEFSLMNVPALKELVRFQLSLGSAPTCEGTHVQITDDADALWMLLHNRVKSM